MCFILYITNIATAQENQNLIFINIANILKEELIPLNSISNASWKPEGIWGNSKGIKLIIPVNKPNMPSIITTYHLQ